MLLSKMGAYLGLVRWMVCLSAFLMAIIGYWLAVHRFDLANPRALWAALAVSAALAVANVLNDILDLPADRINYPERSLPSGRVSLAEARWLVVVCLVISLAGGLLAGGRMFLFTIFLLIAAAVYDLWANKIPLLGNVIVATWCALILAAGYFVAPAGDLPLAPILAALFFILAREFIETISDDAGDQVGGRRSIYALWGQTRVLQISLALIILAVLVLLAPIFTLRLFSPSLYLLTLSLLLILPVGVAIVAVWRDQSAANIRQVAHRVGVVFFSSFLSFLWLV